MRLIRSRSLRDGKALIGIVLFASALTIYYLAVLRTDYYHTRYLDLRPYPDAAEYFAQAKALQEQGWPSIQIGYDKLPARYPLGYPLLMLPWVATLKPAEAVLAPFRTNQTAGVILLFTVFAFYSYVSTPLEGGLAALLLATLPGFSTFCRSSLSEISSSALLAISLMTTYLGLRRSNQWWLYGSALCVGLSLNVRLQSVFFAPILISIALLPAETRTRWLSNCMVGCLIFVVAASPALLVNMLQFGSPLKTGYDLWVPSNSAHPMFSIAYVPSTIARLGMEFAFKPTPFSIAMAFGTGTVFVMPFVLLACVGTVLCKQDKFFVASLLASLSFLIAMAAYEFAVADVRFYLPVEFAMVALATYATAWAITNLCRRRNRIVAALILLLFATAAAGYPSRSRGKTGLRSQTWDTVQFTPASFSSPQFRAEQAFEQLVREERGIVLSDANPVYLNALLPAALVAAPIDENHKYQLSQVWRYGRADAASLAEYALRSSSAVYALFNSAPEFEAQHARLPDVAGYNWSVVASNSDAVIAKLVSTPTNMVSSPAH
jgi:hypothetical protein